MDLPCLTLVPLRMRSEVSSFPFLSCASCVFGRRWMEWELEPAGWWGDVRWVFVSMNESHGIHSSLGNHSRPSVSCLEQECHVSLKQKGCEESSRRSSHPVRFLARLTLLLMCTIPLYKWGTLSFMFYWHCCFLHS